MTNSTPVTTNDPGHLTPTVEPTPARLPLNVFAIMSFVFAITGVALPGIIFGHIALHELKREPETGRGWALAGLIIGYTYIGLFVLGFLAYIAFFAIFTIVANHAGTMHPSPYLNPNCGLR